MNIQNNILALVEQAAQEQKGIDFNTIRDAWVNAGKPSTVQEIKAMFKQLGLTDEQITQTFDASGYSTQGQPNASTNQQAQGQPNQGATLDPKRQQGLNNLIQVASKEQLAQLYKSIEAINSNPTANQ